MRSILLISAMALASLLFVACVDRAHFYLGDATTLDGQTETAAGTDLPGTPDLLVAETSDLSPTDVAVQDTADSQQSDFAGADLGMPDETATAEVCAPDCDGKECGGDGCGGDCGKCSGNYQCQEGSCICIPDCTDKTCGGDGCGGLCGECLGTNQVCSEGQCGCLEAECSEVCCDSGEVCNGADECCVPQCEGKECGNNMCDGSCGECAEGTECFFVVCALPACDDGNDIYWDGCTAGQISEFQVNTYTPDEQHEPAVAALADDQFVVVWASGSQDAWLTWGIYGHHFDKNGTSLSGEFPVNSTSAGNQLAPDVAGLVGGDYIVVWQGKGPGDDTGIFMQRYSASGTKLGGETMANSVDTGNQENPRIAATLNGGFIVSWRTGGAVMVRHFDKDGQAEGEEAAANITSATAQPPTLATMASGGYAVGWATSFAPEDPWGGVRFRMFDGDSAEIGEEKPIPSVTELVQERPVMAGLSGGGLVALWAGYGGPDSDNSGVFAIRYDDDAQVVGWDQFQVNTEVLEEQGHPAVVALPGGGFATVWESSGQDEGGKGIYGQRFTPEAAPIGDEFRVHTYGLFDQKNADIAAFADGSTIVVWQSQLEDGAKNGIFAQRFAPDGTKIEH